MELSRSVPFSDRSAAAPTRVMDEDEFRVFYERTAKPLRAYLVRVLQDISKADDILQEAYLRFLQAKTPDNMEDRHRKNYLFRIATNLVRDAAARHRTVPLDDLPCPRAPDNDLAKRADLGGMLAALNPRQRELLWLAYVERFRHDEIAAIVGSKPASVRPMLARAREKLAEMLKRGGFEPKPAPQEES